MGYRVMGWEVHLHNKWLVLYLHKNASIAEKISNIQGVKKKHQLIQLIVNILITGELLNYWWAFEIRVNFWNIGELLNYRWKVWKHKQCVPSSFQPLCIPYLYVTLIFHITFILISNNKNWLIWEIPYYVVFFTTLKAIAEGIIVLWISVTSYQ